jgi:hypothetical protein
MKLQKRLLLLSVLAVFAFGAIGCGKKEEEIPNGPTGSVPENFGQENKPGTGASVPTGLMPAPDNVKTGTPNGK